MRHPRPARARPRSSRVLGLKSQIQVLWGNVLFERSQVSHHRGDEWMEDDKAAVAKFNEAGCSKDDVTKALMNHTSGSGRATRRQPRRRRAGSERNVRHRPISAKLRDYF